MSVIAMSAPRASVFTFESTAHSSHVLRCLDDQRRRDVLCDVTVVAEGQGFRAHRSVLTACSEYFTHRISPLTQHGAVITLPQEVTAAGFEPLLKFAYTSKLLFGKNNILEIRNSASILGFRDLDDACFDFLLPKFFSSSKESVPFPRKTCCKKTCKRQSSKEESYVDSEEVLLDEKEAKPVADSPSQQEVAWLCNKSVNSKIGIQNTTGALAPVAEGANDIFVQCPKYRKFQLACGKETCVPGKSLNNQATAIRDNCDLSCTPCSSGANGRKETVQGHPTRENQVKPDESWKTEIHEKRAEDGVGMREALVVERDINERVGKWDEEKKETIITDVKMEEKMEHSTVVSPSVGVGVKAVSLGQSAMLGERSPVLILHHCTVRAIAEGSAATRSMGQERFVMDIKEDKKPRDSGALEPPYIHQMAGEQVDTEGIRPDNAWEERGNGRQTSSVERVTLPVNNSRHGSDPEREVAEHRAMPPGSDVGSSQLSSQDPDPGSSSDKGSGHMQNASLDWLKLRVNLNPSGAGCPFFQDLDQSKCLWKGAGLSESEGASHSGVSSLNSGEDGDSGTETEGDSESYTMERARQVQLPFTVDSIVDLSRNDFQQLLKQHVFTREQLEFVHDMRRRSKNRLAAQRCRKRKLDCIYNLQCEINKLKTEREKLIMEKSQLSQMKLKTCHSVSALCQRVCSEANLRPEQLQVLAKYTSPDCPLSSYFPHIDALLSLPVHPPASLSSRSAGPGEAWPSSSGDTVTGDSQHSL